MVGRVTALLREARAAGLTVHADGPRLTVRGPKTQEPLARELLAHKAAVLAALAAHDAAVAWRVAAMRPLVPPWPRPVGYLCARRDLPATVAPGLCPSCGEVKEAGQKFICQACQEAKWIVLGEAREAREDVADGDQ